MSNAERFPQIDLLATEEKYAGNEQKSRTSKMTSFPKKISKFVYSNLMGKIFFF
jgi:hypothetical protein